MAEISASGSGNRYFYFLPAAVYRCVSDHAYSILGWALSESWLAGCTGAVLCSDRNGKWRNLLTGVDGLATSVTLIVAVFFTVVSIGTQSGIEPVTCAVIDGLMGFLLYNVYPASVFMGDTGSLALGGFVAGVAYMLQMPLFILIVGLIYLVEVLSVMIQVPISKQHMANVFFKMALSIIILSFADGQKPE